jgi:hypothetical protein
MFASMLSKSFGHPRLLAAAAVAAGLAGGPSMAQAHGLHIELLLPLLRPRVVVPICPPPVVVAAPVAVQPPVVVQQPEQVWVAPVYQTVCDRQWVPPVTQTVTSRVWVPPATQAVTRAVYVPDQYGYRRVATVDAYGRAFYSRQYVLLTPAHYETRTESVEVAPGHYEDVAQQQVVAEGHWATVERQQEVAPGHWETQVATVPACPPPAVDVCVRRPF